MTMQPTAPVTVRTSVETAYNEYVLAGIPVRFIYLVGIGGKWKSIGKSANGHFYYMIADTKTLIVNKHKQVLVVLDNGNAD